VARVLEACPAAPRLLRLGLPDRFIDHGDQHILLSELGLDADGLVRSIAGARVRQKVAAPGEVRAG
jgi:1-deoxy-D-xylulose-5-phosphate synthase